MCVKMIVYAKMLTLIRTFQTKKMVRIHKFELKNYFSFCLIRSLFFLFFSLLFNLDEYRLIQNSLTKSILPPSQYSSPPKTMYYEQSKNQQHHPLKQHQLPSNNCQSYITLSRKPPLSASSNQHLIQIQHHNIGNAVVSLESSSNNSYCPVVNCLQYQLPHNVLVQKQINTKYYQQHQQKQQHQQQQHYQQRQITPQHNQMPVHHSQHIIHLQNYQQHSVNNERTDHHSLQMQQFHTATVHGNCNEVNLNKKYKYGIQ